jgi:thiamine pyrophosphokinase
VSGTAGQVVSILPVGGDPLVTTAGLRWPLVGERLGPGTSRGISNELLEARAEVSVRNGTVVVVVPATEEEHR